MVDTTSRTAPTAVTLIRPIRHTIHIRRHTNLQYTQPNIKFNIPQVTNRRNMSRRNMTLQNMTHQNMTPLNTTHLNTTHPNMIHQNMTPLNMTRQNMNPQNMNLLNMTRQNTTHQNMTHRNMIRQNMRSQSMMMKENTTVVMEVISVVRMLTLMMAWVLRNEITFGNTSKRTKTKIASTSARRCKK